MPKTTVSCPRCRQPVMADVEKLFDLNVDPSAKQRLLSGAVNVLACPNCGYQGPISQPIVYHDPEKELLLTFFPADLGLPVNEQEKLIGPLINQVVNKLPNEKKKAYLFQPQTMLTMEALLERILEADGITREMINDQQKRLALVQRLLTLSESDRGTVISQEEELIDNSFFALLNQILEAAASQGDRKTAQELANIQNQLFKLTKTGQELKERAQETEAAVKSLQEASKEGLTREKLLDLMVDAPTETRLTVLVSMTRSGMDYEFFQVLTQRIENADGSEKEKLTSLRESLLKMIQEIDAMIAQEMEHTKKHLEEIINAPNVEEAIMQNPEAINEMFFDVVNSELSEARKSGDLERSAKLQDIVEVLKKLAAPPLEIHLLEELMETDSEEDREKLFEANAEKITSEFLQLLNSLIAQSENGGQPEEITTKVKTVYSQALRFSMKKNMG